MNDVVLFHNKTFKDNIRYVYPKELTIEKTTKSETEAAYLDLLSVREVNDKLPTRLNEKRDKFGFHAVNFSFWSGNIPSSP